MRRMRRLGWVVALPVAAVLVANAGCGGSDSKTASPGGSGSPGSSGGGSDTGTKTTTTGGKLEELASTGSGTLKGKVTFDGTPPEVKKDIIAASKDQAYCHEGPPKDIQDQTWKVGPDKGVANVVVWLRAPKGKYFKIPDDEKKRTDTAKLDQPFCAFEPHVLTLYPTYFDGKKQEPTGQKFEVVNNAKITHNTNWTPSDTTVNKGANVLIPPKGTPQEIVVKAGKEKAAGGEQHLTINCNIHPWMKGYAWVFDHPFAAVTSGNKPDAKDYGTYEIKDAPAGAEVELVYWHESMEKPKVLKKVTLKAGDNTEDFKVGK